jgi:hypothetical protein
MRAVTVCFVDIGGIDEHHCLNFLFIIASHRQLNNGILRHSSEFTYRLNRLKPRSSKSRRPPAIMCNIFATIIYAFLA